MYQSSTVLETDRLRLRLIGLEDAGFILGLLNSPGWLRYIGDRGVYTVEDAERYIKNGVWVAYEQYGYGFSVVELKADGVPIGGCGLIRRAGLPHADIGFAFMPEYQGRGFAYEIAAATIRHAKDKLALPRVLGITLPENQRSVLLLQKIGLRFEKMIRLAEDKEELMLFGIDL